MNRQSGFIVVSLVALLVPLLVGIVAPAPSSAQQLTARPPAGLAAAPTALTWNVETVDQAKLFRSMGDRHLALDAAGHPHVAYGDDNLFYAWYDGAAWHYETVHVAEDVGEHAALRLDAQGRAHIAYYDRWMGQLRYAFRAGPDDWQLQIVDYAGSC
jgi:hypothetical protein